MKQAAFFDVEERLARLSGLGAQLGAFFRTVDFEVFRPDLEKALAYADMTELLLTLFLPEDKKGGGGNSAHFRDRAEALIRGMSYVFVWVRDNLGIPIMSETIRTMFSDIAALRDLYQDQIFTYYDADAAETRTVELPPEFDRTLLNPVRDYVTETGGFSNTKSVGDQDKVREQHSYVVGGFGKTFTQMSSTLGHIFRCNIGDVDFRDVKRISWSDVQNLRQGQAIILLRGKRIYTRLFYAGIKPEGVNRVFPTVSAAPALEAPVSKEPATEADDVARRLQEGRDRIEKGDLRPLTGVLGELYQRLGVVLNTEGTPLQDAQELLNLLFPNETSAEEKPFAKLFETLVPPSAQLPRTTEPLHADLDKALLAELVTFETALGLDERAAVEAVTHALNLYARGKELA
ncbi:hypothetical protein GCM10007872_08540 [Gluconobacter sphaericus NBRC 12467]|uniref:Uncharacterized protein n=1 Tax=Gluconobacter sphaericus NBRC 12467 TaxID=1307951 RepID=A0AA37WB89_9PROT|nr:hypothetical protein [Gluconobacter sphaericus]GBR56665.1 hypothetical protein AA12467_2722 [Gluconobacter sphaericus NBRC 12467]GEB43860.1 hypothetical protein GSP01_26420 [Gluconobacter sphaericus NBRC 12467]GLQ83946.1 hypothetical protein GCM10007872_08540 [Gluconobacter sphaericus NBRC 12467]